MGMSLGALTAAGAIGDILGGVANIAVGIGQRKKGKAAELEGRENFLGSLGPSQGLLDYTQEQKSLAASAGKYGRENLSTGVASAMSAMRNTSPEMMQAMMSRVVNSGAQAAQQQGFQTAQQIASASQPLVKAQERANAQKSALYNQDMTKGYETFQQGTQNIMGGISGILGAPGNAAGLASSAVANGGNKEMFSYDVFKDGGKIVHAPKQGESVKTTGEEDHETNEQHLVTGQERIEGTEEGTVITNSKQEQAIYDLYKKFKPVSSPTMEDFKELIQGLGEVYENEQFKMQ